MTGIEDIIQSGFLQAIGGNITIAALVVLLAFAAVAAALRAPAIVIVIATGLMGLILFGPSTMNTLNGTVYIGSVGASGYVFAGMGLILAFILYYIAKSTLWREY